MYYILLSGAVYYKCGIKPSIFAARHSFTQYSIHGTYGSLEEMEGVWNQLTGAEVADTGGTGDTEVAGYDITEELLGRKIKQLSQGHKESIAKALRGRQLPQAHKDKIAASLVGKKKLPSHRRNIGAALKKRGING